ncbi:hypothetical protein ACJX0J_009499 [Zea mays]
MAIPCAFWRFPLGGFRAGHARQGKKCLFYYFLFNFFAIYFVLGEHPNIFVLLTACVHIHQTFMPSSLHAHWVLRQKYEIWHNYIASLSLSILMGVTILSLIEKREWFLQLDGQRKTSEKIHCDLEAGDDILPSTLLNLIHITSFSSNELNPHGGRNRYISIEVQKDISPLETFQKLLVSFMLTDSIYDALEQISVALLFFVRMKNKKNANKTKNITLPQEGQLVLGCKIAFTCSTLYKTIVICITKGT